MAGGGSAGCSEGRVGQERGVELLGPSEAGAKQGLGGRVGGGLGAGHGGVERVGARDRNWWESGPSVSIDEYRRYIAFTVNGSHVTTALNARSALR